MALALLLTMLLPFALMQSSVGPHRLVAEFVAGADGSAPGMSASSKSPEEAGWAPLGPTTGTVKLAVIAVQFPDVPHTRTLDQIRQDYFGVNNSLAAYYLEVSYGKLSVTGDVFGWYTLPYPEAHYGHDCAAIDDSDCSGFDQSWQIAQDAVTVMNNAVNFGKYDYFAFLHSGNGEESTKVPNDVWSVTYVSGVDVQTPSRTLNAFNIVAEREARGQVPLGVYCAEFGHLLGLPDMFDKSTGRTEMGPWELEEMGAWNGHPPGSSPAEMSSWDRLKIGWLPQADEEVLTQSTPAVTSLNPLEDSAGVRAAKIVSGNSYYLLEVRRPIGFDLALPSFGVVAYEITSSDTAAPFHKVAGLKIAFDVGYLYVSNQTGPSSPHLSFKLFNQFSNGSYLIGFGPSSFMQVNTLTLKLEPATPNVTVIVNGAAYSTDKNGTLIAINFGGADCFNVTVPAVASLGTGSHAIFDRWSNGANSTILSLPDESDKITAIYHVQYYVTVNTVHGTPDGSGWYDQGANATVSLPETINDTQPDTRYEFTAWQGSFNETSDLLRFKVEKPTNLTAIWRTQYYLAIDTGGHATASGSRWYDADSNASYSLSPPKPANGSWYVFQGWTGDCTTSNLSGSIDVTRPIELAAKWVVLDWVTPTFVDAAGVQIRPTRPLVAHLLAANGTIIQLDQSSVPGVWLVNGTYLVSDVTTLGFNLATDGQSFATTPNGAPVIHLALYSITFKIHDVITSLPISGAVVTIILPDHTAESNSTGSSGTTVFEQLPTSRYPYEVNGDWLLQSTGNATISTEGSTKLDIGLIYLPSLIAVIASAFTTAIALLSLARGLESDLAGSRNKPTRKSDRAELATQSRHSTGFESARYPAQTVEKY